MNDKHMKRLNGKKFEYLENSNKAPLKKMNMENEQNLFLQYINNKYFSFCTLHLIKQLKLFLD